MRVKWLAQATWPGNRCGIGPEQPQGQSTGKAILVGTGQACRAVWCAPGDSKLLDELEIHAPARIAVRVTHCMGVEASCGCALWGIVVESAVFVGVAQAEPLVKHSRQSRLTPL